MKMITIAILLLLIQVSAGMLNAIGLTETYSIQPDEETLKDIENNIKGQDHLQNLAIEETSVSFGFGFGYVFRGIWLFVQTMFWAVVEVKGTVEAFMCGNTACSATVSTIANYIATIVYFIWGIALAQFISNKGTRGMN